VLGLLHEYMATGGVMAVAAQVLPSWLKFKSHLQSIFGFIAHYATIGNFFALITFAFLLVSLVLIAQDVNRDVTVIEPIAVPKALAESGYTPEVAGHRMRDALDALQQLVNAEPESPLVDEQNKANQILAHNVAARDELPDFVVPQIGLSLSAIVSSIRSVLQYTKGGKVISGELIFHDHYALRVRVDGQEVFNSGFDSDNPDDLLDRAAPAILTKVWPALGATMLYHTRPDQAVRDAEDIIATLEVSDPNVLVAYILKGDDFVQQARYEEAKDMFRKAIRLNRNAWIPHNRLGLLLLRQGKFDDALKQFETVVRINPKSEEGYNNMGAALVQIAQTSTNEAKLGEARQKYERAIELRPHDAGAHNNLGLVWKLLGNHETAMTEFHRAIESDRNNLYGHWNLAAELAWQSDFDGALKEYRIALDCAQSPRDLALLHIHMGDARKSKAGSGGNLDEAIAEYQRAVEIDPSYPWTHVSLAAVLRDQGKLDEAIADFRAALQLPHTDKEASETAQQGLDEAIQASEKVKEKAKQAGAYKEQALPAAVQDAQAAMR
jgi:tetratricopeptide (TPR) repeat protein